MLNVWSTAADERVVNYFQQSEISSANHFTIMRSKSEPNFSREEPKRQQLTVTLIYTSLIERILPRDAHSQRNYGNGNPDLHLIKTSSLNRDMLIYNSHRSDPTSQWELAEATEIFCSKDVAHFGLVSTKSWVFAAVLCYLCNIHLNKPFKGTGQINQSERQQWPWFSFSSSLSTKNWSRPQITSLVASNTFWVL